MLASPSQQPARLEEKFTRREGWIYLTGIEALVRLPVDQRRRDWEAGLNTAIFISGYPGSPLAGYDLTLERYRHVLKEHHIVHVPGVNEELAATAVYGSQLFDVVPGARYQGVLGMWYGKSPGVDRCGDAFKHANFVGTGPHGGVLVLGGDDHQAKSSTLPCQSEYAYLDANFPILYPGSVQEIIDLGLHGFALSRFSGAWVAFKLVTNICDGGQVVQVSPERPHIRTPEFEIDGQPYRKTREPRLIPPRNLELEGEIHHRRLEAARRYARENSLLRIVLSAPDATLGIVTAGKSYYDLRQALRNLRLHDDDLKTMGVRLLKADLIYPLEPTTVLDFARGLEQLLVIEEKRGFLEGQLRELLYNEPQRPRIYGKRGASAEALFPIQGELDPDVIARILVEKTSFGQRLSRVRERIEIPNAAATRLPPLPPRFPHFCSGCPHNTSTVSLEGQIVGLGIGCHLMSVFRDGKGSFYFVTQMGGEGVPWIAMAPFTETRHIFQNLGDGTYMHSGSLALQNCVSAGIDITFKLLYNDAVAMTGGQNVAGNIPIPELTHKLRAEGAREIFLVTEDRRRYRRTQLAEGVRIYDRSRLPEVLRKCEQSPGVSVLLYDQMCAKKKRRLRKRGRLEDPQLRVFINEDVCEGCGDCGVKSSCASVRPVETEFGRKTVIDQSSCNKDYSCLRGDCPSFVTLHVSQRNEERDFEMPSLELLPEPAQKVSCEKPYPIFLRGIGGTGVVTATALMATAASMEGKFALTLDQTGLAQMGGVVSSHLILSNRPFEGANKTCSSQAQLLFGFDTLGTAEEESLKLANPGTTVAVVNSHKVPTGHMVRNKDLSFPSLDLLRERIDGATDAERNIYLDADHLSDRLFGTTLMANVLCLGVAYQAGLLPLRAESLEAAIQLNGVAAEQNGAAFRWGRLYQLNPKEVLQRLDPSHGQKEDGAYLLEEFRSTGQQRGYRELCSGLPDDEELRRLLRIRLGELLLYQDAAYARTYLHRVLQVYRAEQSVVQGSELSQAVARYLYKLMAYKDEYEVARLLIRPRFERQLGAVAGRTGSPAYHLHPPALRALGLKDKIRVPAFLGKPFLRILYRFRFLRGTWLDPFGRAEIRSQERALISWYNDVIDTVLSHLRPEHYPGLIELARLPDQIRGYEDIKMASIERTKRAAKERLKIIIQAA